MGYNSIKNNMGESDMVLIRRACEKDLKDLADLFGQLTGEKTVMDKMKANFDIIKDRNDYIILGAELDGKIVGTVMGIICKDFVGECRPFMVIENVIVSSDCRGKGVGKKLFEALEKIAAEHQCTYTMLVSRKERVEAHKFYQAIGYGLDVVQGFKKYL